MEARRGRGATFSHGGTYLCACWSSYQTSALHPPPAKQTESLLHKGIQQKIQNSKNGGGGGQSPLQKKLFENTNIRKKRSSRCGAADMDPTRNHEVWGSIPGLDQWVKNRHCPELWYKSQTQLGSCMAEAGSCSSD